MYLGWVARPRQSEERKRNVWNFKYGGLIDNPFVRGNVVYQCGQCGKVLPFLDDGERHEEEIDVNGGLCPNTVVDKPDQ